MYESTSSQEIVAHISSQPVVMVKKEARVREKCYAWLLCCPLSPEFWQAIRGKQIRPHTCLTFGELAVSCSETDAVARWEEWTLHFPSPAILNFLWQDADLD